MADERRAHEVDVAIATIGFLGQSFNGKFRPDRANPFRAHEPEREKTPEERKAESEEGWALLREGLKFLAGGRGG